MVESSPAYLDLVYKNDNMIFTDSCHLDENNDIKYVNPDYVHLASPKNVNINTVVNEKMVEGFDTQSYEECPYKRITNRINLRNNQWNLRNINDKNWSPTETVKKYVENNKMDGDMFNTFTKSFVRDKCWNENDFKTFMFISNELNKMIQKTKNENEKIDLLLNPNFYGYYHVMLDKLDTLNVMCLLNNKCESISNILNKQKIKEQAEKMIQLIDIYGPVFYRVVDLFDRKLKNIDSKCNIDPVYFELTDKIKSHLLSTNYSIMKSRGQIKHNPVRVNTKPITQNIVKKNNMNNNMNNNMYVDDVNYFLLMLIVLVIILYVLLE